MLYMEHYLKVTVNRTQNTYMYIFQTSSTIIARIKEIKIKEKNYLSIKVMSV